MLNPTSAYILMASQKPQSTQTVLYIIYVVLYRKEFTSKTITNSITYTSPFFSNFHQFMTATKKVDFPRLERLSELKLQGYNFANLLLKNLTS